MSEKDCKNCDEICCTRCGACYDGKRGCFAHITGRYWANGIFDEWCQEFFPKSEFNYNLPAWADDKIKRAQREV